MLNSAAGSTLVYNLQGSRFDARRQELVLNNFSVDGKIDNLYSYKKCIYNICDPKFCNMMGSIL